MKKILTIILDGFGMREDVYGNAVKNAGMNNFINIWNNYPHCLLKSSGEAVGLPEEQCGYSELGHKLIGAGKNITTKQTLLDEKFKKEKLQYNKKISELTDYLKLNYKKNLHICILLSDGGVSSHIKYLKEFLKYLELIKLKNNVYIHAISDGRDANKFSICNFLTEIEPLIKNNIHLVSVCGRYYALDDTKDYRRTKVYYDLLYDGRGVEALNIYKAIEKCYEKKLSDEYLPPLKSTDFVSIETNDVFLFLNYSKENQRQLLNAMCNKDFVEFNARPTSPKVYSLFEIDKEINENYFFESEKVDHCLCEYLGELGIEQAHIFESIKTNSVLYYLNGEKFVDIEKRDIFSVDSPNVERFDMKPEMNALTVAKITIECMEKDYDFILVNFANPDEVGHTGNYQATINSLQAIDVCLGKIMEVAEENFYKIVIVSSHANTDTIIDHDNNIVSKNTTSPVPFIIMDKKIKLKNGSLESFAPTLLKYMDIAIPKEMKDTEILII